MILNTTDSSHSGAGNVEVIVGQATGWFDVFFVRKYVEPEPSHGSWGAEEVGIPSVTTTAVSSITLDSASSGGNVTSDGGAPVTVRGVCWSTQPFVYCAKGNWGTSPVSWLPNNALQYHPQHQRVCERVHSQQYDSVISGGIEMCSGEGHNHAPHTTSRVTNRSHLVLFQSTPTYRVFNCVSADSDCGMLPSRLLLYKVLPRREGRPWFIHTAAGWGGTSVIDEIW